MQSCVRAPSLKIFLLAALPLALAPAAKAAPGLLGGGASVGASAGFHASGMGAAPSSSAAIGVVTPQAGTDAAVSGGDAALDVSGQSGSAAAAAGGDAKPHHADANGSVKAGN